MKVILKQDIKTLGKKEQMVEVSDGYARNYLLPKGFAVEATSANINVMKTRNQAEETKRQRDLEYAKEVKRKLEDAEVILKIKAGENGKIFGSIGAFEIAEKIKKDYKVDIDKKKVILSAHIKTLGLTDVEVKIYPGVSANVRVKVENE